MYYPLGDLEIESDSVSLSRATRSMRSDVTLPDAALRDANEMEVTRQGSPVGMRLRKVPWARLLHTGTTTYLQSECGMWA